MMIWGLMLILIAFMLFINSKRKELEWRVKSLTVRLNRIETRWFHEPMSQDEVDKILNSIRRRNEVRKH